MRFNKTLLLFFISLLCVALLSVPTIQFFESDNIMVADSADAWWDSSWSYRKPITINSSQVESTMNFFPILINITDSHLASNSQNDGGDIRFVTDSGDELDYDIEDYDSSTGKLKAYVETSVSSSSDNTIYIYYGNPSASNGWDTSGTWISYYEYVLHLNDDFQDSSIYSHDGTNSGSTSIEGIVADGQYFNSTEGDYISFPQATTDLDKFTIEVWVKLNDTDNNYHILGKDNYIQLDVISDGSVLFSLGDGSNWYTGVSSGAGDIVAGNWYHITVICSGTSKDLYIDGVYQDSETQTNDFTSDFYLGDSEGGDYSSFNGTIDELRIRNFVTSVEWIQTSYNSINNATSGGFFTIGSLEEENEIIGTEVDTISPKNISSNPFTITVTNTNGTALDNVTLYYKVQKPTVTDGSNNPDASASGCETSDSDEETRTIDSSSFWDYYVEQVRWDYYGSIDSDGSDGCCDDDEGHVYIWIYEKDGGTTSNDIESGVDIDGEQTFNINEKVNSIKVRAWSFGDWYAGSGCPYDVTGCCASVRSRVDWITYYKVSDWVEYETDENGNDGWSFEFDFPQGTGNYQFYSVGKSSTLADENPPTGNDSWCDYTGMNITDVTPANNTMETGFSPDCSFHVTHDDSTQMTVNYYSSGDGITYTHEATYNNILNETVSWNYADANSMSTTFYWKITVDDGIYNISKIYHFSTGIIAVTNPSPEDEKTNVSLTPNICVDVQHGGGYLMNLTFYNADNWTVIGTNTTVGNGTYCQNFSHVTNYFTDYNWSVNVSDGQGHWTNQTYEFKSEEITWLGISTELNDISSYEVLTNPLYLQGVNSHNTIYRMLLKYRYSEDGISWNKIIHANGTQTEHSSNLNDDTSLSSLVWSHSDGDNDYFRVRDTKLIVQEDGNYFLSYTIPVHRTDRSNVRTAIEAQIYVNGEKQDVGVGRSSYIRCDDGTYEHIHSSVHQNVLLENLSSGDEIQIKVKGLTSNTGSSYGNEVDDCFSLYAEYVENERVYTTAEATQTTSSTNLNQGTPYPLVWNKITGRGYPFDYEDSDSGLIELGRPGYYHLSVNIPLGSSVERAGVKGKILLEETPGVFEEVAELKQGYIRDADSHIDSSLHWSGVINNSAAWADMKITVEQEAESGTVTVDGEKATLYIEHLGYQNITGLLLANATQVGGGDDWNPSSKQAINWSSVDYIDTDFYTHSTSSNNHQITVEKDGRYLINVNGAFESFTSKIRLNPRISIDVNGERIPGSWAQTAYIRAASGHEESSNSLLFYLNLSKDDVVTITITPDGETGHVDDSRPAHLSILYKGNKSVDCTPYQTYEIDEYPEPYDWYFDFPNGFGYYQFYSEGQNSSAIEKPPSNGYDVECHYNQTIYITNETPEDNAKYNNYVLYDPPPAPTVSVDVVNALGNDMTISFYAYNHPNYPQGTWTYMGGSTVSGTVNNTYLQSVDYNDKFAKEYIWSVNISDSLGVWMNESYSYTSTPYINDSHLWNDSFENSGAYLEQNSGINFTGNGFANYSGGISATDDGAMYEVGTVETSDSEWTTVQLYGNYDNPVVICSGQVGYDDGVENEATARPIIKDVTSNDFKLRYSDDSANSVSSTVGYIVMDEGHHTINGVEIEAGTYTEDAATSYQTVFWDTSFSTNDITVIDQCQEETTYPLCSMYEENSIDSDSYRLYWEGYDTNDWYGGTVTMGYIAMEKGAHSFGEGDEVNDVDEDWSAGNWRDVNFQNTYDETPIIFCDSVTTNGGDPTVAAIKDLTTTGFDVTCAEGDNEDSEQSHATEDITWMVFKPTTAGVMKSVPITKPENTDWYKLRVDTDSYEDVTFKILDENDTVLLDNLTGYNDNLGKVENDTIKLYALFLEESSLRNWKVLWTPIVESNPYPSDNQIDIPILPNLAIDLAHKYGEDMNITWWDEDNNIVLGSSSSTETTYTEYNSQNGFRWDNDSSWSTIRNADSASGIGGSLSAGGAYTEVFDIDYQIFRSFVFFDTTSLTDIDNISSVYINLNIYQLQDNVETNPVTVQCRYDSSEMSPGTSLDDDDWDLSDYDKVCSENLTLDPNIYTDGDWVQIEITDLDCLNPGGVTSFGIFGKNTDIDNNPPAASGTNTSYVEFYNSGVTLDVTESATGDTVNNGTHNIFFDTCDEYLHWYNWTIEVFDESGYWNNETYSFKTEANPTSISNPFPVNESINNYITPRISIDLTHGHGRPMDITFYDVTNNWSVIGTNNTVENGTYSQLHSNAFDYGTEYIWSVNVTDSYGWMNRTYNFVTDYLPEITLNYPENESDDIFPQRRCFVHVTDNDTENLTITFSTNASGSWVNNLTYTDVEHGRYYWNFTEANEYDTTYYWRVYVDDGQYNISWTYQFTTVNESEAGMPDENHFYEDTLEFNFNYILPLQGEQLSTHKYEDVLEYEISTTINKTDSEMSTYTYEDVLEYTQVYDIAADGPNMTTNTYEENITFDMEYTCLENRLWYDANWSFRKQITLDGDQIEGDHDYYTFLIRINDTDFINNNTQIDGDDFVFVSIPNIEKYSHEIESFDNSTGELVAWVNITNITDGVDKSLWVYFGNLYCENQEDVTCTWDSFEGVWHLDESGTGTRYDSSPNNNDATANNYDGNEDVDGILNGADDLDGSNDWLNLGNLGNTGEATISFWYNQDDSGNTQYLLDGRGTGNWWWLTYYNNWNCNFHNKAYTDDTTNHQWYHALVTANSTETKLYINGDLKSTGDGLSADLRSVRVGTRYSNSGYFDGTFDEIFISSSTKDVGWAATHYNNLINSSDDTISELQGSIGHTYNNSFLDVGQIDCYNDLLVTEPYPEHDIKINSSYYTGTTGSIGVKAYSENGIVAPTKAKMDIYLRTNKSGSWETLETYTNVNDGYYDTDFTGLDVGEIYYWSANISDRDTGLWHNRTFEFESFGISTYVDEIDPYYVQNSSNPLTITVTNETNVDNVTLYYRWYDNSGEQFAIDSSDDPYASWSAPCPNGYDSDSDNRYFDDVYVDYVKWYEDSAYYYYSGASWYDTDCEIKIYESDGGQIHQTRNDDGGTHTIQVDEEITRIWVYGETDNGMACHGSDGTWVTEIRYLDYVPEWTNWIEYDIDTDSSDDWSFEFDFPNSTGRYQFYSIGKKANVEDEEAPSYVDSSCYYTGINITSVNPTNNSLVDELAPTCSAYIESEDGTAVDVNFYTSTDASTWTHVSHQEDKVNTTVSFDYTSATSEDTTYYWKMTVNTSAYNLSYIYNFKTYSPPHIEINYPEDTALGEASPVPLTVTVTKEDGGTVDIVWKEYLNLSTSTGGGLGWGDFSDWSYRIPITVSNAVDGYQVQLIISYDDSLDGDEEVGLGSNCNSDFSDIRFSDSSLNSLDYWIEDKTDSDEATVWVETSTDSTIYLYYGNSGASSESNGDNTFLFFDDFSTDPTSDYTHSTWLDSHGDDDCWWRDTGGSDDVKMHYRFTLDEINSNKYGTAQYYGIFGTGSDGDTSNGKGGTYLYVSADTDHGADENTAIGRVYTKDSDSSDYTGFDIEEGESYIATMGNLANNRVDVKLYRESTSSYTVDTNIGSSSHMISDYGYHWIRGNYYEEESSPVSTLSYESGSEELQYNCKRGNTDAELTIDLDYYLEAKYADTEPSFSYGSSEENDGSTGAPTGGGSGSTSSDWYDTDWSYKKEITIASSQVSGSTDLTNFPILVKVTDTDLRDNALSNGDDIIFVDSDHETLLDYEVESYDSSTGEIIAWVKIPTLGATSDTTLYVYYGNSGASNQENPTGVWSNGYVLVYHFTESSGTVYDSTSNNNDATSSGGSPGYQYSDANSPCGYGIDFEGSTGEYISAPHSSSLDITNNLVIESWINPESFSYDRGTLCTKQGTYYTNFPTSGKASVYAYGPGDSGSSYMDSSTTFSTGSWQHLAWKEVDGDRTIYYNGNTDRTGSYESGIDSDNSKLQIGRYDSGHSRRLDAKIDELRISDVDRSNDWVKTNYNTMNSPSTFLSFGEQTEPSSGNNITVSSVSPTNGSQSVYSLPPNVSFTVNHTNGTSFDVYVYTNRSGSWTLENSWLSQSNNTFSDIFSHITTYNHQCNWSINITDSYNWSNTTYSFTTDPEIIHVEEDVAPGTYTYYWTVDSGTRIWYANTTDGTYNDETEYHWFSNDGEWDDDFATGELLGSTLGVTYNEYNNTYSATVEATGGGNCLNYINSVQINKTSDMVWDRVFYNSNDSTEFNLTILDDSDNIISSGLSNGSSISSITNNTIKLQANFTETATLYDYNLTYTTSDIENPQDVTATTLDRDSIQLDWTKGTDTEYTYIEYHTSADWAWNRGEHTELVNITGSTTTANSLTQNTTYYFKLWSYDTDTNQYSYPGIVVWNTTDVNSIPDLGYIAYKYTASWDFDGDGFVDLDDANIVWANRDGQSPYDSQYDINNDGIVDFQDSGLVWTYRNASVPLQPTLSVALEDTDSDSMDISFATNDSGTMEIQYTHSSVSDGTYTWQYTNANSYSTCYDWRLYVNDGFQNISYNYTFTTVSNTLPTATNEDPDDNSYYTGLNPTLSVDIADAEGHEINATIETNASGTWTVLQTYNDQSNGTITASTTNMDTYDTTYYWSVNLTDSYGWRNYTYQFTTTDNNAPDSSSPSPSDGGYAYLLNPTLSATVTDADGDTMTIYIRSNASGSWSTLDTYTSATNGIYSGNPFYMNEYGVTYYWRVCAFDGIHWGNETYSFSIIQNYAPEQSNPSPSDGATDVNPNPTLSIDVEDDDGDSMDITFRTNAGGSWADITSYSSQGNGTYTTSISGMDGVSTTYTWSVNLTDGYSWVNESYSFTTSDNQPPQYSSVSPADEATGVEFNPTLSVTVTENEGETFDLWIRTNVSGTWVTLESWDDVTDNTYTADTTGMDSFGTTYYWSVNSTDGLSYNNVTYSFTTAENTAPQFSSITPADGATDVDLEPQLSAYVEDAEANSMDIYFRTNATGTWQTTKTYTSVGNDTYYRYVEQFMDEYNTKYWWSINATDSYGWTNSTQSLTTKEASGPELSNEDPTDLSTDVTLNPTLSVDVTEPDGLIMDIYIRTNASGTWTTLESYNNYDGTYTADTSNINQYSTIYYWSVNASNGVTWTNETYEFTTGSNSQPILSNEYPSDGASGVEKQPIFSIDIADPEGDGMAITISSNSSGSYTVIDSWGQVNGVQNNTFTVQDMDATGSFVTYGWWVNVSDGHGWTNESYSYTTIDNYAPILSDESPTDASTDVELNPTLSITVDDPEDHSMNILFLTEIDDSWITLSTKTQVYDGTYTTGTSVFDSYGTEYTWYVNASDGTSYANESYTFTTIADDPPVISNPSPSDEDTGVQLDPTLSVTVSEPEGQTMNVTIKCRVVGDALWGDTITYNNVENADSPFTLSTDNVDEYDTEYEWKIDADDGKQTTTVTYTFTTRPANAPEITNPYPADGATNVEFNPTLSVDISDSEASTFTVIFYLQNDQGNYQTISTQTGGDGTYTATTTTINEYDTTYNWRVRVISVVTIYNDYSFSTGATYTTQIQVGGEDFFIWLGEDTTASVVSSRIGNLNEANEYIAIWSSGSWSQYNGDGSGTNWDIDTYDVVKTSLSDGNGVATIYMTADGTNDYTDSRDVSLTSGSNNGVNFVGYTDNVQTTLSAIATSCSLISDEYLLVWDDTDEDNPHWSQFYIIGFITPTVNVYEDDVVMVRVSTSHTWTIGGK